MTVLRGFANAWLAIGMLLLSAGGFVWWAVTQQQNISDIPGATSALQVTGTFTYSAVSTEFPSGLFLMSGDGRVLGANYIRARNISAAVYVLLGKSAGIPLKESCFWSVDAVIEIANPAADTASYAYISPMPKIAAADFLRAISHGDPRQVCSQ